MKETQRIDNYHQILYYYIIKSPYFHVNGYELATNATLYVTIHNSYRMTVISFDRTLTA
jgi:hypothetical protein